MKPRRRSEWGHARSILDRARDWRDACSLSREVCGPCLKAVAKKDVSLNGMQIMECASAASRRRPPRYERVAGVGRSRVA